LLIDSVNGYGYDDQETHPAITLRAIELSNLKQYLTQNYNAQFIEGFESFVSGKRIRVWLTKGSTDEDAPICRATNHFHNPLKSWDRAGITSIFWPICPTWDVTSNSTRHSALTWATGYNSYNGPIIPRSNQQMGWDKAREYFYAALTSTTNADREANFVKTFQSVGQVMHLLQDMAVPAHVRNDFWNSHVWTGGANPYELYAKLNTIKITSLTKPQINSVMPAFTNPRQTDFWDTSDNSVSVPLQITNPALQSSAGLAEYTNANFVSEGTLFSNSTEFAYPSKNSTGEVVYDIPDPFNSGKTVKRPYYYKTQDWEVNYHLAGVNYTYFYDPQSNSTSPDKIIPPLDDYVHKDYADRLLPRAVGYSAGLLNYFFRGQMDIVVAGPNSFKIKNLTDEDMSGTGAVYMLLADDLSGTRYTFPLSFTDDAGNTVTDLTIPKQSTSSFIVTFSGTVPNPKEEGVYTLVFKGKLGNEEGAVAAKVIKPVKFNILQTGNKSFKIINYQNVDMTGALDAFKLFYYNKSSELKEITLAFVDSNGIPVPEITIAKQSTSSYRVLPAFPTKPEDMPKEKGTFLLQFTGKLGVKDVVAEQLITPHFIASTVSMTTGQADISEYDLQGNRIANLTESLPHATERDTYAWAVPNPINSDLVLFYDCRDCAGERNLYQLTKSTGHITLIANRTYHDAMWSKDGSTILHLENEASLKTLCPFSSVEEGSFSPDGIRLVAEGVLSELRSDVIVVDSGANRKVDMENYTMVPFDCNNLDLKYRERHPEYHPHRNKIVFYSDRDGKDDFDQPYPDNTTYAKYPWNIYVVEDIVGAPVNRLTTAPEGTDGYFDATWSPDGENLLMTGYLDPDGLSYIYIIPASGGTPRRVTQDGAAHSYPKWLRYLGE
jgi:hypothetical protein